MVMVAQGEGASGCGGFGAISLLDVDRAPGQQFDTERASRELERLGRPERVAFAAFWAQRLFPMYLRFSQTGGHGSPARLQHCLDVAWDAAAGRVLGSSDLEACQHELIHLAPDIDAGMLAYAAMEGAAAAWDCLETVRIGSASHAIRPAEAFGQVIEVYLVRREAATLASSDVDTNRPDHSIDDELWRPHSEVLEYVLSALARSRGLDGPTLESVRSVATDSSVEVLVDLLAAASGPAS
jgi:uncharacterized protein YjaG (DUF416 family)